MILVALAVALGGFVWGFDATVISGAVPFIQKYFQLTGDRGDFLLGLAVSCLGWGVLGGTAVAGFFSDRFGRKKVLITTAVFFTVSALASALTTHFSLFVAARVLGGIAVGGAILIAPVYIAEISPPRYRGSLVSLNQLMIVLGISASFFSNYALLGVGENNWRWMLGMDAVPAVLYFFLLFAVPESPRWLYGRGATDKAREILIKAGGPEQAEVELERIRQSFAEKAPTVGLRGVFSRRMRFILFIALAIAFFQQITGINAIFYYLPTIFVQAGGGTDAAFRQAVLVGLVNLGMTFVAIRFVDRLGRKPLLLIGATGMAVSLLACSWAFHGATYQLTGKSFRVLEENKAPAALIADLKAAEPQAFRSEKEYLANLESTLGADRVKAHKEALVTAGLNIRATLVLIAIMGFVASFAISLGPVMWVLLSEIFPNQYRGAAMSLVGFWNSAISASVTFIFPWELSHLGSAGTFLGYGLMAAAAVMFIALFIPETKGKSLEELEGLLMRK
ncbi:MAG TPA: sugar porter family MFS transporter [Verrucomicrobiota bacterium]|nr:sugar porter family MFS transporter [Verrucomicrobiota bacterium]HNU53022.1 sugar porter family MFS transporter [Verrucomicrobiota bacterium]